MFSTLITSTQNIFSYLFVWNFLKSNHVEFVLFFQKLAEWMFQNLHSCFARNRVFVSLCNLVFSYSFLLVFPVSFIIVTAICHLFISRICRNSSPNSYLSFFPKACILVKHLFLYIHFSLFSFLLDAAVLKCFGWRAQGWMFSWCSGCTTGRHYAALSEFALGNFWHLELKFGDALGECFPGF